MILFFSGGTALSSTARELARMGVEAAYLITPFDSGGSSGALRAAFDMPAVGDLRSRILDLMPEDTADAGTFTEKSRQRESETPLCRLDGAQAIRRFCIHRLGKAAPRAGETGKSLNELCREEFASVVSGRHELFAALPGAARARVFEYLGPVAEALPEDCNLQGACLGNLVLAGAWLKADKVLSRAVEDICKLGRTRGIVRPTVDRSVHLVVRLEDGQMLAGQHRFTGKSGEKTIASPIRDLLFCDSISSGECRPVDLEMSLGAAGLVEKADLICFPVGSFFSSILANLLPRGTGRALAANPCPKVFVPNLGTDPELYGYSVQKQLERLLAVLNADAPDAVTADFLNRVLVDPVSEYPGGIPEAWLREHGIEAVRVPLVSEASKPLVDGRLLANALRGLEKG